MKTFKFALYRNIIAFIAIANILISCGGSDSDSDIIIDPLPAGSGLYVTTVFPLLPDAFANFYKVNEITGETVQQPAPDDGEDPAYCPSLSALDSRTDGIVFGAGYNTAAIYEVDPRTTRCRRVATTPEIMRALAVRSDGHIFTVSDTNKLYEFDGNFVELSATTIQCASGFTSCPITGIDFDFGAVIQSLYVIDRSGVWGALDSTATVLVSQSGVGLADDFDIYIDSTFTVRGFAGSEYRIFDNLGNLQSNINLLGGTLTITGAVYR